MRVSKRGGKIYIQNPIGSIGKDCFIHPTATLGGPGFGIERDEQGKPVDFKHLGQIIIGNDVRIGEHSNVHRGSLSNTVIEDHVRIDCFVHIAHNAIIGEGTFIVAGSVVGGSCVIGKKCWLGEGVMINDHVNVGDQAIVASGSVVVKNVARRDIVAGAPAESIKAKVKLSKQKRFSMVGY